MYVPCVLVFGGTLFRSRPPLSSPPPSPNQSPPPPPPLGFDPEDKKGTEASKDVIFILYVIQSYDFNVRF